MTWSSRPCREPAGPPGRPPGSRCPRARSSAVEYLGQGGGELIRLAHAAVLAAEESVVAAREGDRRHAEPGPGLRPGWGVAYRPSRRSGTNHITDTLANRT